MCELTDRHTEQNLEIERKGRKMKEKCNNVISKLLNIVENQISFKGRCGFNA